MLKENLTGREAAIERAANSATLLKESPWEGTRGGPVGEKRNASAWWSSVYKGAALLVLNALVAFACLELAALGFFNIQLPGKSENPGEQLVGEGTARENVSYYASQDWAKRYWHEFRLSRKQQFYSFVGWRRAPFKGQTIEVNEEGIRVTPGATCGDQSFKVFMFGASEMWGTGSPNWATIPAHLQKGLQERRKGPVCVVNFAESAYVSMQGVIMLLMQLRSGNVPDAVVFYTLVDDVYSAYQSGRAGVLENLELVAAKFEERRKPDTWVDRIKSTRSYGLIDMLLGKLTVAAPRGEKGGQTRVVTYETMGVDADTLSEAIAQDYLGNYRIVSALAQKYGFQYHYFLPPLITLGSKILTPEEQDMKRKTEVETSMYKLFDSVYRIMDRESPRYQNLHSMVHAFDSYGSLIFIDESHLTPVGNGVIAEKMLDAIHMPPSDK
ncbi:MAG TPA: hypothetical protein VJ746_15005 [Nitrospira sp.]|nr:hypothetical protein [Nitrospira sp.]